MADLTDDDVKAILNLFEGSDFDYLQFESGDLKLSVSKHGFVPEPAAAREHVLAPSGGAAIQPPPVASSPVADDQASVTKDQSAVPQEVARAPAAREGLVAVTAPIVGTFYVAPDPQSPPFVSIGDRVEDGATVGLIEVMKVFTSVCASVAGEVVEVLASDAGLVQQGEVLFYIRPDQPASSSWA